MAKTLEFFFDYMSPTSFLGWTVAKGVIERTGAELAQIIGRIAVLYRRAPDPAKRRITVPG